jgi:hypothetical protein
MLSQSSVAQQLTLAAPGRDEFPKIIRCRGAKPEESHLVLELETENGALLHLPAAEEALQTLAVFLGTYEGNAGF